MYSERFQAFHKSLIYIGKCGFTKRMIVKKGYQKIKSYVRNHRPVLFWTFGISVVMLLWR